MYSQFLREGVGLSTRIHTISLRARLSIIPVVLLLCDYYSRSRSENELGVGSSGISGETKGPVRRAKSEGTVVGGGRIERKGAAISVRGVKGRGERRRDVEMARSGLLYPRL